MESATLAGVEPSSIILLERRSDESVAADWIRNRVEEVRRDLATSCGRHPDETGCQRHTPHQAREQVIPGKRRERAEDGFYSSSSYKETSMAPAKSVAAKRRYFSVEEANKTLPLVRAIVGDIVRQLRTVNDLGQRLDAVSRNRKLPASD